MVWKESVADCKHCKAITRLLFSGVGLWSKSGVKVHFSKLKRINIQHWPCQWLSSKQLETWNWEISDFSEFKTTGNSESSDWEKTFWMVILLGIPCWELRHLSGAPTWKTLTSWFNLVFFCRDSSCLESTMNPEDARLWWQNLPTKDCLPVLPVHVNTAQTGESRKALYASA